MINKESFQFYPKDWLGDQKLNMCMLATKGAWIDLLCYMHQGDQYGYLVINGKSLTRDDIRKILKVSSEANFDRIWGELIGYGIIKQDRGGAFFSQRLVKEYKRSNINESDLKNLPFYPVYKEIMSHFSKVTSKSVFDDPRAFSLMEEWFNKGYKVEDFKSVIDCKNKEWKGDARMENFIRPTTLFGQKFLTYINEAKSFIPTKKQTTTMQSYTKK